MSCQRIVQTFLVDDVRRQAAIVTLRHPRGSVRRKRPVVLQSLRSVWKSSHRQSPLKQVAACLSLPLPPSNHRTACPTLRTVDRASVSSGHTVQERHTNTPTTMAPPSNGVVRTTPHTRHIHRYHTVMVARPQQMLKTLQQRRHPALRCHGLLRATSLDSSITLHLSNSSSESTHSFLQRELLIS